MKVKTAITGFARPTIKKSKLPVLFLFIAIFLPAIVWLMLPDLTRADGHHTHYVATTGDDQGGANDCTVEANPCATIGHAIATAPADSVIHVAGGTYNEHSLTIDKNLTIDGDGAGTTIVDANDLGRIFNITAGTVTIEDLTVTNGREFNAGGINIASSVTLTDVVVSGNETTSTDGGGIVITAGGTLTMTGGSITNNTSIRHVGGIHNLGGATVNLSDVTISGNTAAQAGGGLWSNTGTVTLTDVIVDGNTGPLHSGGIRIQSGGMLTMSGGAITNNMTNADGGGLFAAVPADLTNVTISGNTAGGVGGGILNSSTLTLTDVIIDDNTARISAGIRNTGALTITGGAITNNTAEGLSGTIDIGGFGNAAGTAGLTNVTISGNTSANAGGGVWVTGGTVTLADVTVTNNSAGTNGGGIVSTGGTLIINGGSITNNMATLNGGGLYGAGTVTLGGMDPGEGVVITGNSAGGQGDGVHRASGTLTTEGNWWGDLRGPQHVDNPNTGSGQEATGVLDFSPWCADDACSDYYELPAALTFNVQPTNTVANNTITPALAIRLVGTEGYRAINATNTIDMTLSGGATTQLDGTTSVAAVDGDAAFNDLSIGVIGTDYQLNAVDSGTLFSSIASNLFDVITPFSAGDGTEGNPYQITDCELLQATNLELDAHYVLNNDIDCSDTVNWNGGEGFAPVGDASVLPGSAFTGTLDGQGFVVNDLFINRPSSSLVGLFGALTDGAEISNIGMQNVNITGDTYVGGLIAAIEGSSGISVMNVYITGSVTGGNNVVGGLIGYNNGGAISDVYATVNVDAGVNGYAIGGLIGQNFSGSVTNAYATGAVSIAGGSGVIGGLVGDNQDTIVASFWDTQTSGLVSGCGPDSVNCNGATGKTTAEMKDITTFSAASWDIEVTNDHDLNDGYPFLSWQAGGSSPVWYIFEPLISDGLPDCTENFVDCFVNPVTGANVILEVDDACTITTAEMKPETDLNTSDPSFEYPTGLMNFTLDCGTPGYTTTVKQYYFNTTNNGYVLRKHNPNTEAYFTIEGATIEQSILGGQTVTIATYQATDGGELDMDGQVNGTIVDPAGLAERPSDLADTGQSMLPWITGALTAIAAAGLFIYTRRKQTQTAEL